MVLVVYRRQCLNTQADSQTNKLIDKLGSYFSKGTPEVYWRAV